MVSLALSLLLACPGDGSDLDAARGDCNPVDDSHCMLPFPSSFFLAVDPVRPTALRVDFGAGSLPESIDGVPTDPARWNSLDGFPILGPLYALFPGVDPSGLVPLTDLGASIGPDSTSILLDVETGERVPHFAELEAATADDPDRQLLILRPVAPMAHGHRHVVALRGLTAADGALLAAPDGFRALRDEEETDDPDLERQREAYEDGIFPALEAAGWSRDELQLAWDFTTVSEDWSLRTMRHVRDEALAWAGEDGPPYTLTEVEDFGCDGGLIGRQVEGTLEVPLFLESWEPGHQLRFGDDGLPLAEGTVEVPFMARVPCALLDDPRPEIALQFGHGLFGDRKDVRSSGLDRIATSLPAVVLAVDWTGMKDDDIAPVTLAVATDVSDFAIVPDRLHHGHMETLLAARALKGALGRDEAFAVDGVPLVDPSALYFYGNSQGSVLGGATLAMGGEHLRGILGVPGAPFSLLLARAQGFVPFLLLLQAEFADPVDVSVLIPLMQMLWDPTESGGWANLQETPVLMQAVIGDASVTTLGAHVLARSYGASLVSPETRPIWGLEATPPPFTGSALVEFDFGVTEPLESVPATDEDHDPHDDIFGDVEAQAQIVHYLTTGEVEHFCEGPCDPD